MHRNDIIFRRPPPIKLYHWLRGVSMALVIHFKPLHNRLLKISDKIIYFLDLSRPAIFFWTLLLTWKIFCVSSPFSNISWALPIIATKWRRPRHIVCNQISCESGWVLNLPMINHAVPGFVSSWFEITDVCPADNNLNCINNLLMVIAAIWNGKERTGNRVINRDYIE